MRRTYWVVLTVLILAECTIAIPITVYQGELSKVNQLDAVAAIAAMESGHKFLELLNGTNGDWHPMSFWRYMVDGYPSNATAFNILAKGLEDSKVLSPEVLKNGLSSTIKSSLITFTNETDVTEMGKVNVTAWSLVYSCFPDDREDEEDNSDAHEHNRRDDCYALIPVVISDKAYKAGKPRYVELFRRLSDSTGFLVNGISAHIAGLKHNQTCKKDEDAEICIRMPLEASLPECSNRSISSISSPVPASYGIPSLFCYNASGFIRNRWILSSKYTLDSNWTIVHIQNCSTAPFLLEFSEDDGRNYLVACVYTDRFDCIEGPSGPYPVNNCSRYQIIDSMLEMLQIQSAVEKCGIRKTNISEDIAGSLGPSSSHWEASFGQNKSEFENGQPEGGFCYVNSSSFDLDFKTQSCKESEPNSGRCDPINFDETTLKASMRDTAESFLVGHAVQFNQKNGPYQSRWTAAAVTVATVLGVVMAVQSTTTWQIRQVPKIQKSKKIGRWFCRKSNTEAQVHQDNRADYAQPADKPAERPEIALPLLILINMLVGAALFSPVLLALRDQSERGQRFNTWAIFTKSQTVNSYGTKYIFVTFVQGSSKFNSISGWCYYITGCIVSVLAIAILTHRYYSKEKKPPPAPAPVVATATTTTYNSLFH